MPQSDRWQDGTLYDERGASLAWTPWLNDGFARRDGRDVALATGLTERAARQMEAANAKTD